MEKRFFILSAFLSAFLFCACLKTFAQIPNRLNFDKKIVHYGIRIGYSQAVLNITEKENSPYSDTLYGIGSYYVPGLLVGVLADLRLGEYVNLRLSPGLCLNDRNVEYYFKSNDPKSLTKTQLKTVESVFGDLPLELKIRSKRWINFRPYLLTGMHYSFNLASLRKITNIDDQEKVMQINPNDLQYIVGAGFDFYFRYFKFAIELKMSLGINNLVDNRGDIYTDSIEKMKSRMFFFTLTFE